MTEDLREAAQEPDRKLRACPACGAAVHREHRRGLDRLVVLFRDVRRYRCAECPWEGLLPATQPAVGLDGAAATASTGRHAAWILGVIAAVALLLAWMTDKDEEVLPSTAVPVAGVRLDATDPRADGGAVHELRRGCTWTGPDTAPYGGTFRDALASAGVPQDAVAKLDLMRERGIASDRVIISTTGVESTDHRRHFSLTAAALAFDRTVCFTTRMELPPERSLTADLYEVLDAANRRYAVAVLPTGGNVAVLEEQTGR